ncbi:tandem-95 repeat protein (plasmid) [Peteryoungia desertarenae]|uniref:Tandem-95 repeat protein n=1 Tax=Peteryoungia desertarenae TaxID=1813451 RepID=A0ABX6QSQ6_9HYPH|nr:tandem-95 repeat protein [Peteryoungia desertarenae]QLF71648.1 tandem-95 repeat protein [Peteryoungia desertarenae]
MSVEDPRQSAFENNAAASEFETELSLEFASGTDSFPELEVAQAQTTDTTGPIQQATAEPVPSRIIPDQNNVVRLPVTVSIDELRVDGPDLILVQADGSEITIVNGAARIPTFIIADVELPQQVLFAALEDSNINVAAGPDGSFSASSQSPSSGGDFDDGPFDGGPEEFELVGLLEGTNFSESLAATDNGVDDGEPSIPFPLTAPFLFDEAFIADTIAGNQRFSSVLPFNPGPDFGTITAIGFVAATNVDEEGNGPQTLAGFTSGGLAISIETFAPPTDGTVLNFLALRGVDSAGNTVFTITVDNRVTGAFTFELVGKLDHPDVGENGSQDNLADLLRLGFTYTVTDLDGDFVIGNFSIDIQDDAPLIGGTEAARVDEDFLRGGNRDDEPVRETPIEESEGPIDVLRPVLVSDGLTVGGNLNINWGADNGNASVNGGNTTGVANDRAVYFSEAQRAALEALGLTSDGVRLVIELQNNGQTLVAYKPASFSGPVIPLIEGEEGPTPSFEGVFRDAVFDVTLSDEGTGSYSFTLFGNLDHPERNSGTGQVEEDLAIQFGFTVRDSDGDRATSTFTVSVNDDSPVRGEEERSGAEDEAVNDGNDEDDRLFQVADGSLNIRWGADDGDSDLGGNGDRSVAFTNSSVGVVGAYGETLTSLGQPVSFTVINGVLVGYTGEAAPTDFSVETVSKNVVFYVTLSDDDRDSYEFRLVQPLDHATNEGTGVENDLSLTFNYTATDSDGDTITGSFTVDVRDDVAMIGTPFAGGVVEEEQRQVAGDGNDLIEDPRGADDADSWSGPFWNPRFNDVTTHMTGGTLSISWGSDNANDGDGQPGDRSVQFGPQAIANLEALNLTSDGDTIKYTIVTMSGQQVLLAYTGSVVPTTVPTNEDAAVSANVVFQVALSDAEAGSYAFKLFDTLDHQGSDEGEDSQILTFQFTATDSDGDVTEPATFSVKVIDDQPIAMGTILARVVEEEELTGGNEDRTSGSGDLDNDTSFMGMPMNLTTAKAGGPLNIFWGGDDGNKNENGGFTGTQVSGDRSVVFATGTGAARVLTASEVAEFLTVSGGGATLASLTSEGRALVYTLSGDGTELTARAGSVEGNLVFTVNLMDADRGSYEFELKGVLDHPVKASGASNEDVISFKFTFTARDGDGDIVKNDFTVRVIDDSPVRGEEERSGAEDEAVNDGNDEDDGLFQVADGSLNIRWGADDGDSDLGGNGDRSVAFTNSSVGVVGAYGETLTSLGQPVSFTVINGVLVGYTGEAAPTDFSVETVSKNVVFYVTLSDDDRDSYEFRLVQPLDHATNEGTGVENDLSLTFNYTATDSDGDTITGSFTVDVRDDVPVFDDNARSEVSEDGTRTVTASLNGLDWGADDGAARALVMSANVGVKDHTDTTIGELRSNGKAVSFTLISGVLVAYVDAVPASAVATNVVFTVTPNSSTGSYTFDLRQPLDHTSPVSSAQHLDLTFGVTAVDSDGDPATGAFTVRVDAAGSIGSIDYSNLTSDVFVNLSGFSVTRDGQTVAADTATDRPGDNIIGRDGMAGVVSATGGSGNDILVGGGTNNILNGGDGNDLLIGGKGNDTLNGGLGDDTLIVSADIDVVSGFGPRTFTRGDGSTVGIDINGRSGEGDSLNGGTGFDAVRFEPASGANGFVFDRANSSLGLVGVERFEGTEGDDIILLPKGYSTSETTQIETDGGKGNDILQGSDVQGDKISGGDGNDLISGLGGNDDISGGNGADQIWGGAGDDTIDGGADNDTLHGNAGDDTVIGGDGDDRLTGGQGVNRLFGGKGDDVLGGDSHSQTTLFDGGEGTDTLHVKSPGSKVTVNLAGGTITGGHYDGSTVVGIENVENKSPNSAVEFIGDDADNILIGGNKDDILVGGKGNDTLRGGAGDDRIIHNVGDGDDIVDGGSETGSTSPNYDELVFNGDATARTFTLGAVTGATEITPADDKTDIRVSYTGPNAGSVRADEIERVTFNLGTGGDTVILNDVTGSAVAPSTVVINGGTGNDTIDLSQFGGSTVQILDGGGSDTVKLAGVWTDYVFTMSDDDTYTIRRGDTVIATVKGVEFVQFGETGDGQSGYTMAIGNVVNVAPVAGTDAGSVVEAGGVDNAIAGTPSASGNVLTNDTDGNVTTDTPPKLVDQLSVSKVGNREIDADGETISGAYGDLFIKADGEYVYTLDNTRAATQALTQGQKVTETFSYTVQDVANATATGEISIEVTGTNDAPVLSNVGGTLAYVEGDGPRAIDNDLSVSDVDNTTLASAVVQITGGYQPGQDVLAFDNNDSDAFGNISASFNSANGELTLTSAGAMATKAQFEAALRAVTYGNLSESPTGADRIISVSLNDGNLTSNVGQVTVTVQAVNDAPVNTVPSPLTVDEDSELVISGLSIADADAGAGAVTVTLEVQNGTLTLPNTNGVTVDGNDSDTVTLNGSVTAINAALVGLKYQGKLNFNGTDQLKITTSDNGNTGSGGAKTDTDTVSITVNAVNDAPTVANAIADQSIEEEGVFNYQIPSNTFADVDGDQLTLSATLAGGGALPSWLQFDPITRTLSGMSPENENGFIDVTVTASDGSLDVSETFRLTVTPVNDAPVAVDDVFGAIDEDSGVRVIQIADILANDSKGAPNEAGQTLNITALTNVVGGTAEIVGETIEFTPFANYNGTASFNYTISDNGQTNGVDDFKTATGLVSFPINAVNDAPTVANAIADQSIEEEGVFNYQIPSNTFADVDGDQLTLSATLAGGGALPSWLQFDPITRTFSGTSPENENGFIDVTVTASDGSSDVSETFRLTVTPVNDAPVITSGDSVSVAENTPTSVVIYQATATDAENQPVTFTLLGADANRFDISSTGAVTFKASPDWEAPSDQGANNVYNITVVASDGTDQSSKNVEITVTKVPEVLNRAPVVGFEPFAGASGYSVTPPRSTSTLHMSESVTLPNNLFTDPDGNSLTLTANLPSSNWAFSTVTGQTKIHFNKNVPTGVYDIVVTASDGNLATSTTVKVWVAGSTTSAVNGDGDSSANSIVGGSTGSEYEANSGNDFVDAGGGNDTISGGSGNDALFGGMGNDTINGDSNDDYLNGEDGDDKLDGDSGNDWLVGGAGNDELDGDSGNDVLIGGTGNDILDGDDGVDSLYGGDGSDILYGRDNDAVLDGGSGFGTDTLRIKDDFTSVSDAQISNIETIQIRDDNQTVNLSNQTEGFKVYGTTGNDRITMGSGNDTINSDDGDDVLTGNGGADIFHVVGNNDTDTITDFTVNEDKLSFFNVSGKSTAASIGALGTRDNNVVLLSQTGLTTQSIRDAVSTGDATNNYVIAWNSQQNRAEVWYDDNWRGTGSRELVAVLSNINTLAKFQAIDLDDLQSHFSINDPIILDLDKNGFAFSSIDNGVTFDIDADGNADQIAWTSDDGILAYDANGNGTIDNGSEIFTPDFNGGKFASGVAALASLDSNGDGKIDAGDAAFKDLKIWIDGNNNGVSDEGELLSLSANGVASISLTTDQSGGTEDGQVIFAEGEFTFVDGSTGNFVEVGFDTIFGSEPEGVTLHGGMGEVVMTGTDRADTFVFDETALNELDVADVITDFSSEEGDVLDVSGLLDTLLGAPATAETAMSHLKASVEGGNTTVSVQTDDGWKDVVTLQNHDTVIKILFDEKHSIDLGSQNS